MAGQNQSPQNKTIAILGAGSWGATLAWLFATSGKTVCLWSHNEDKAAKLQKSRRLEQPLEVLIPESVFISADLSQVVQAAEIIIFCCKSQAMRSVAGKLASVLSDGRSIAPALVSAAKGLELSSLKRMSEVIDELLPGKPICALSGPNLAPEILKGLPAASVIASNSADTASFVQHALMVPSLRLYSSTDLIGVELGGTIKNVIAIAAGCSDGLHLGTNAKSALLTRGLAEVARLSSALGANPLTLSGLAGMGDLFATCSSSLSRNYRLGMAIASGVAPQQAVADLGATAEGVPTAQAVCEFSKRLSLELPIAEQVHATLQGTTTPRGAIMALMTRPPASEW